MNDLITFATHSDLSIEIRELKLQLGICCVTHGSFDFSRTGCPALRALRALPPPQPKEIPEKIYFG
ncbi:hypothetical protein E2C01_005738 [Portunus trituberculatus]|uniref:Uncharacterized protein n=1 Tax=Portunus trituberculatus TaxID=210409 RepID=A0A5B7CU77_PORTR|nr:hypothetical protein [Portunus trituberculatus]